MEFSTSELEDILCCIESTCYEHDYLNWDNYPEDYKRLIIKIRKKLGKPHFIKEN